MAGKVGRPISSGAGKARQTRQRRQPGSLERLVSESRYKLPLPVEQRAKQGFVVDVAGKMVVAPWCWPDCAPEPIQAQPGWLAAWCRDRACYRLEPTVRARPESR
jgi:hypothetical protein